MEELDPQTGADPPQGLDGPSRNSFPGPNVGGRRRPDSAPNSHGESPGYSYLCRSGGACLDADPVDRRQEFRLATKPGGDIEDLKQLLSGVVRDRKGRGHTVRKERSEEHTSELQ